MADHEHTLRSMYKELLENGNLDALDEFCREDFIDHEIPAEMGLPPGLEGMKQWIGMVLDAFSDISVDVHDVIVKGDQIAARATFHMTHTGEFMKAAPTNRRVAWETIDWLRFEGGKAAEHWGRSDDLGLLQQLGLIPPMS